MTFSLIFLVFGCFGAMFSEAQQVVPDQALLAVYGDPYGTPYYGPGGVPPPAPSQFPSITDLVVCRALLSIYG